jgi:ATP-dependent DNA ligase
VNGHNLRDRSLKERQDVLVALKGALTSDIVRVTDPCPGALGTFMYQECQRLGLEGVVAKRLASMYRPGRRSHDWRKIPFRSREEFIVGGYLSSPPNRLSALILGQYDRNGRLVYAGLVGSGLSLDARKVLLGELRAARTERSPFTPVPALRDHWGGLKTALSPHWTKPKLVVEVEYRERLEDGLRHAALKAVRPDKSPRSG